MKKAQNQLFNMNILQTPCLVRFVSAPIELPAKQITYFPKPALNKIRELAKLAVLMQADNERTGRNHDVQDIMAEMCKPALLRNSGLAVIRGVTANRALAIETDFLQPGGTMHKTQSRLTIKVNLEQVSKPYLVSEAMQNGHQYILKVAEASRLSDYQKGRRVAFKEITFFTSDITLRDVQPVLIEADS